MVPRKVIQDSDGESDASISPIKAQPEYPTIGHLSDPQAAPQQSGDPSTNSTGQSSFWSDIRKSSDSVMDGIQCF